MNPSANGPNDAVDRFRSSLFEAIAWRSTRNTAGIAERDFRSPELRPGDPFRDWAATTNLLIRHRREILFSNSVNIPNQLDLSSGGLLLFDPGQSLSDGAAQVESNGFFDADNIPPWDLWIAYIEEPKQQLNSWTRFDSFLLCWIPQALSEMVDHSLAVNPERCLEWARNVDSPFLRLLRSANLLV